MSDTNRFGRIISPRDVEKAVAATLALWIDDYLGEAERLYGYQPGAIIRPRDIITRSEFEKWQEDQVPVVVIMNAGLAGVPERRANGRYDASWHIAVIPIVSDTDEQATRDLAEAYTVACRLALLQHKMMKSALYPGGLANFTSWQDEQYGDMPFLNTRSLNGGRVVLEVGVENVLTEQAGPRDPFVPPSGDPGPWPKSTDIEITTVPLSPLEAVTP